MNVKTLLRAGLLGLSVAALSAPPVAAELLRIQNGGPVTALNVPMNRAVIVESDQPFAELSIANPGIADISTLSDRAIYVLGKTPGRTTLTILGPDAQLIANVDVQVTPDVAEFRERLRQILPGEPIEVRTANDGLVLSGIVSSSQVVDRAMELAGRYAPDRVSNLMSVGGSQQVMLKVRFAEMSRSVSKDLGARFNAQGQSGSRTLLEAVAGNVLGGAAGSFGVTFLGGNLQFSVFLEALEARGLARTLAEPNLVALTGQEAKFLAGGEYPIPVLSEEGRVTVTYKPFGVELNFTPWVLGDGVINLALNAAVSGIDPTITVPGPFPYNAFNRRETSTTVELRDGESFAIAGLLQDDFRSLANQVPWVGDIPIIGALFRSSEYRREQTELVIVITAHLVSPTRGEALALPTDRVRLPSESDLFLFGRTEGRPVQQTGAVGEVARQGFSGPFGYVMD
jgi:pilus assembly protein CpaC